MSQTIQGPPIVQTYAYPLRITVAGQGAGRVVAAHEKPDVFDFYAAMTGLPAATIRGLRGADGEAVTEACFPFLPRFMKPADG